MRCLFQLELVVGLPGLHTASGPDKPTQALIVHEPSHSINSNGPILLLLP